jgi:hypothetical protein
VTAVRLARDLALRDAKWATRLLDRKHKRTAAAAAATSASSSTGPADAASTHELCRAVSAAADAACAGIVIDRKELAKAVNAAGKVVGSLKEEDMEALSDIIASLRRPGGEGIRKWSECGRKGALSGKAAALVASALVAQAALPSSGPGGAAAAGTRSSSSGRSLASASSASAAAAAGKAGGAGSALPLFTIDRVGVAAASAST